MWFSSARAGRACGAHLHELAVELAGEDLCGKLRPGACAVVFGTTQLILPASPKHALASMQVLVCMHAM